MIKSILKVGLILIAGVIVYNYFLGTPTEKENSKEIFEQVKDMGKSIGTLIKSEKEKFDKGKYDDAMDKLSDVYQRLKENTKDVNENYLPKIEDLEKQSDKLKKKLDNLNDDASEEGKRTAKEINIELEDLMQRTEKLVDELSQE